MVWVATGTLMSKAGDAQGSIPEPTSHYLRPGRFYRCGRMAHAGTDTKGKAYTVKAKPYDFRLRGTTVSKDGAFDLTTGEWTKEMAMDNPNNESNDNPYSLKLRGISNKALTVNGQLCKDGDTVELRDGDAITFHTFSLTVSWVPVVIRVALSPPIDAATKAKLITGATLAGIKLGFTAPLGSRQTYLVTNVVGPDQEILFAGLYANPIHSLDWLTRYLAAMNDLAPRPANLPVLDDETKTGMAIADKFEDVGADYKKFYGHSKLECDWTAHDSLPDSLELAPEWKSKFEVGKWTTPQVSRANLFNQVIVVFNGLASVASRIDEAVIKAGGGHCIRIALEDDEEEEDIAPIGELFAKVESFRKKLPQRGEDGQALTYRVAFMRESGDVYTLTELASKFECNGLLDGHEITQAIYDCSTSGLFSVADVEMQEAAGPSTHRGQSLVQPTPSIMSTQGGTASLGMSFSIASGAASHPEERALAPGGRAARQASFTDSDNDSPPRRAGPSLLVPSRALSVASTGSGILAADTQASAVLAAPSRTGTLQRSFKTQEPVSSSDSDSDDDKILPPSKRVRLNVNDDDSPVKDASLERQHVPAPRSATQKRPLDAEADSDDDEASGSAGPSARKHARRDSPSPSPTPAKKEKVKVVKPTKESRAAEKAAEKVRSETLLTAREPKAGTKKALEDGGMANDFNKLQIVKPVFSKRMPKREGKKLDWDQYDSDDDEFRRMLAEEEAGYAGIESHFRVRATIEVRPEVEQKVGAGDVPEKWKGLVNVKTFVKIRAGVAPGAPAPAARRVNVKTVVENPPDFGLGAAYKEKTKKKTRQLEEEDDEDMRDGTQMKLSFAAKPKAKAAPAKGKAKVVAKKAAIVESEEEEEEFDQLAESDASSTLEEGKKSKRKAAAKPAVAKKGKGKAAPVVDLDEEMDDLETQTQTQRSAPKASTSKKAAAKPKAKVVAKAAPKVVPLKKRTETVVISDSDDESTTFAGFSTGRATGTLIRKRK